MPALGCGTLIPDAAETIAMTRNALAAGFRHFDCAERYRNEREVGMALQATLAAGEIAREDIFVTTKLWNTNHRPERVEPAFEASLERLGLKYLDLVTRCIECFLLNLHYMRNCCLLRRRELRNCCCANSMGP